MNCLVSQIITSGYSNSPQFQVELPEGVHKYLTKLISAMTSFMKAQNSFGLKLFADIKQS